MKNIEKFKDEILDIISKGGNIAVDNITYEPVDCNSIGCGACLFYGRGGCSDMLIEWARLEYKKPVVISYKDSLFLNFIKEDYRHIARDKTGLLYAYVNTPKKDQDIGCWCCWGGSTVLPIHAFNIDLPMIKWEDEKPWKISYLKKLKVVKNY